jgi:hypothetical protein
VPWPRHVGALLKLTGSRGGQALRWGLRGLRASLQAALEETPDDPGCEPLRGLLAELDALLERMPGASAAVLPTDDHAELPPSGDAELPPPTGSQEAEASSSLRLLGLANAIARDPQLQLGGKAPPIRQTSDEVIWNDVQRFLLRLPSAQCQEWQRRSLQYAEQVGARADPSSGAVLPLMRDEVSYPGLSGGVQSSGLRSAARAELDPRVQPPADGELRFLAGVVSACLWFAENDPALCHCLKSVFRFGVAPLSGEQRPRYVAELLRLWGRVRAGTLANASRQELKEVLKARLDLDEAIHSLVYLPCAAADSWWGRLQGQAREGLLQAREWAARAGCTAHLQVLGGNFADVSRLAPDSLQVDSGEPGEVSACLRVWARIDGEEIKGRVLYR